MSSIWEFAMVSPEFEGKIRLLHAEELKLRSDRAKVLFRVRVKEEEEQRSMPTATSHLSSKRP